MVEIICVGNYILEDTNMPIDMMCRYCQDISLRFKEKSLAKYYLSRLGFKLQHLERDITCMENTARYYELYMNDLTWSVYLTDAVTLQMYDLYNRLRNEIKDADNLRDYVIEQIDYHENEYLFGFSDHFLNYQVKIGEIQL